MELWIRSQDKKFIVKVNNGIFINKYCGQGHINGYEITCGCGGSLGTYSEERALEVLDEIQSILMPISEYKQEVDNIIINYRNININTYVYEMPKE